MKKIFLVFTITASSLLFLFAQSSNSYTVTSYANECVDLSYNLRMGSRDRFTNYEVSLLQDFLSPRHLYLPDGPTGYFGPATLRAVKMFQSEYGISPTGYVGPITRSKIAELTCRGGGVGRACPADAKICPDGRSVGRVGPYCEFAPCSGISAQAPSIYSVSPSQVSIGGLVSISGTGFISSGNEVFLNNSSIGFAGLSGAGMLTIVIPRTIGTPCPTNVFCIQGSRDLAPGMYSLKVVNTNGTSNAINLVVTGSTIIQPPTPTPTPTTFSSSVTSGQAPLSVQFYADRNTTSCSNNSPYSVTFGDGTQARMDINGINHTTSSIWDTSGITCGGYFTTHTYTQAGTYTAQLYKTVYNTCVSSYNNTCPLWYSREDLVGTITITVSQSQSQLPTIAEIQSVRTGSTSTIYVGEEARITGTNLALIFPSSGLGARLDVQIGGVNISPYNIMGTSLSFIVPALTPGTYTVTVTNSYGASNAYTVTVANQNTVAPTIVSFSANPPTRESGSESILSWTTQNANTCAINGLSVPTVGSTSTRAFTTDTYTLTCVGTGGTVSQTVYVPVYVIDCQEGYYPVNGICVPQTNSCTKDAWICPGGTTVGRIPPLCNFAACPPYALP